MTRTRSSLGWTVEGTEGSRKEVGSVQGEGDDGRGAVDAAAAEFCLHPLVLTHTLAPTPLGGGLEVGTFTWPDLKWSDRRLRTGAVTRGGRAARARTKISSFLSFLALFSPTLSFPTLIFRRQVCSVVLGAVGVVPTRQASPAYSCHRPKEGRTEAAGEICESLNAELPFSHPRIARRLDVQFNRSGRH